MPPQLPEIDAALTRAQIEKWACAISEGRDAFPKAIGVEDRNKLAHEVRKRLRRQLLRLVAKSIAQRLHDSSRGEAPRS